MRIATIERFPNYIIYEDGRIQNKRTLMFRKIHIVEGKFKTVSLRVNGNSIGCQLNKLVAESFIQNPNGYAYVKHKDGNRLNCSVDNLEWSKYSALQGSTSPNAQLSEFDVEGILNLHFVENRSMYSISKMYDVCYHTVREIIQNRSWKHIERPQLNA